MENDSLAIRETLALAYHILAMEGQADFHLGHITAREKWGWLANGKK
ncbi:MAG: hypothetical protein HY070_10060 [Chloroflexi bacterium]|nr:hypothetical protein [Chloroflexota bacterium]